MFLFSESYFIVQYFTFSVHSFITQKKILIVPCSIALKAESWVVVTLNWEHLSFRYIFFLFSLTNVCSVFLGVSVCIMPMCLWVRRANGFLWHLTLEATCFGYRVIASNVCRDWCQHLVKYVVSFFELYVGSAA